MKKYLEDILIISGLAVIISATFILSETAGLYCLGGVLFGLGLWFAKHPPGEG